MTELPEWPKEGFPDRAAAEAYAKAPEPARLHTSLDKQRIKLAREWLFPHPCPNCLEPMAIVDALHVEGDNFVCSRCEAKLLFTVPLVQVGPVYWEWRLAPGQIGKPKGD